jgi:TonB family protein
VLLDEIGRGTSTYDGVAIAWAVTECLHNSIGCKTIFATHYHELTQLTEELEHVRNFNVAVREVGDEIVFLHRLEPGGADRSYGIHVGRLAGLPDPVVTRAWQVLKLLEAGHHVAKQPPPSPLDATQLGLFGAPAPDPLLLELDGLDVNTLSPIDALNRLAAWQHGARIGMVDATDNQSPAADHRRQVPRIEQSDGQVGQGAPPPESEAPVALNPDVPIAYPPELYEQKVEGDVTLRLFVDSTGRLLPESTRVAEPSGYPALDAAAVAGSSRLRFAPGKRHGIAVPTAFLQPVEFRQVRTTRTGTVTLPPPPAPRSRASAPARQAAGAAPPPPPQTRPDTADTT